MSYPLTASNLWFKFLQTEEFLLRGVDLRLREGEILAVVGLSGCGKSTLCHCLCGIIPLVYGGEMRGEVRIDGRATVELTLPRIATRLGIVFQNPETQLFSPSVEDEVAFGPENLCLERKEIGKRIDEALGLVGMEGYRHRSPRELSGGQKQLVALASVLSLKPEILIFDEATSQLDPPGREAIRGVIRELADEGKAVLMVEHDPNNLDLADRVLLLTGGRLEEFRGDLHPEGRGSSSRASSAARPERPASV